MSPLRLVILAVLFYIGYHLVRSLFTQGRGGGNQTVDGGTTDKVRDILVEDPVCHTLVPKKHAIRLRHEGTTYYFCSEACCDSFSSKAGVK